MKTALLVAALLCAAPAFAEDTAWQPEKTWVFAVGVLNFENKKLATWPDEGRVDAVMIEAYKKRGVPEDHIVFIKNADATKENLVSKFAAHLSKAGKDDTFVFYYAGHGSRDYQDDARPCGLCPYDSKAGVWAISDVFNSIDKNFKGSTVLLTADCCHSGALALEAPKRSAKISYGVLASSHASSRSTGNWTFTQCLVDMLNGSGVLDDNADGNVTFTEAARYFEQEMAFCEGQLSCSTFTGSFSKDTVMAKAGEKKKRVGEHCEAEEKGKWYKVKILDSKEGQVFVTWIGWGKKWDGWIDESRLRPYKPQTYEGGTKVQIEYDKKWYPAKVLQSRLGLHLVHYDGYPDADDEWVPINRIKLAKEK